MNSKKNIIINRQFKYVLLSLAFLYVIGVCGIVVFSGRKEAVQAYEQPESKSPEDTPMEQVSPPAFFAYDISAIELGEELALEDLYITNRITRFNHFYIDDSGVLWAYGNNEYGQLGIGEIEAQKGIAYKEFVKVAEDVVSVDFSQNSYFCIYLTGEGKLYGMGSNMLGLLGQNFAVVPYYYSVEQYEKVPEPVLLMEDVSYARAGRESIVALKTDGSVWWWGQYRIPYSTRNFGDYDEKYWQCMEDEQNPAKMLYNSPQKLLDNCVYATTGNFTGAAITEDGDLYTWGLNILGECGTEVTGDDYVRHPAKVLENVRMVWPEQIGFNNVEKEISEDLHYPEYNFNLFVQLRDGTILAAGEGLGEKIKTIEITGDLDQESIYYYSDSFVPVRIKEYSEAAVREVLNQVKWETDMEEVKGLLRREGVDFTESMSRENCLVIEDSSYFMCFGEKGGLNEIYLQRGGSSDGRFALGMTMEEVAERAGCELEYVKNTDEDSFHACLYNGDRYYEFIFSVNGILYAVSEMEQEPF